MAKGDYLKYKADPDDGTTPISPLLLEAVAIAKLSGTQKGILIHLMRQTYGWLNGDKRLKEEHITLAEWSIITGQDKPAASKNVNFLVAHKMINRREIKKGKGFAYSINTHIDQWNGNCIDIGILGRITGVVKNDNSEKYTMVEMYNRGLYKTTIGGCKNLQLGVVKKYNESSLLKETPINKLHQINSYKESGIGKNIQPLKEDDMIKGTETDLLLELRKLEGWKTNDSDVIWLSEIIGEFPIISVSSIRKCRDWHTSNHPNKKHNWKNAIRNWLEVEEKSNERIKGNNVARKTISGNKPNGTIAQLVKISEDYNQADS